MAPAGNAPIAGGALTGRGWLIDLVQAWRLDPDSTRWFLLTGPSGSGKTSVSRHLVGTSPTDQESHDLQPWTYAHFANRRQDGSSTSLRGFTRKLAVALVEGLPGFGATLAQSVFPSNIYLSQVIERNDGAVYGLFAQNLHIKHAPLEDLFHDTIVAPLTEWASRYSGTNLDILVDGVDETVQEDGKSLATLLAELPADPVSKIFVSTKSDPQVLNQISGDLRRVALDEPPFRDLHLSDLREFIEVRTAGLPLQEVSDITTRADGNFLVAETVLANLDHHVDLPGHAFVPLGLAAMYAQQIDRLSQRLARPGRDVTDDRAATLGLLGILAASQRPLSSAALSYLADEPQQRSLERLAAFRPLLTVRPLAERPGYALHHASLAEFLRSESVDTSATPNQFFTSSVNAHRRFRQALDELLWHRDADLPPDLAEYLREHGMRHAIEYARSVSKAECLALAKSLPRIVQAAHPATGRPLSPDSIEFALRFCAETADPGTFERLLVACAVHPLGAATPLAAEALAEWTTAHGDELIIRVLAGRSGVRATVGVDAALRLEMPERLLNAMSTSRAPEVSELAAYALYLRWSAGQRAAVEELIDDLALKVRWSRPLRSRRRLSFLADISILLYTHNVEDRDLIAWGDRLWHRLLVQRLGADKISKGPAASALATVAASTLSRRLASATLFAKIVDPHRHFRSPSARSLMLEASQILAAGSLNLRPEVLASLLDSDLIMHRSIGALLIAGMTNRPHSQDLDVVRLVFASGSERQRLWALLGFAVLFEPRSPWAGLAREMTETLLRENPDILITEDGGTLRNFAVYLLPLGLACGRGLVPWSALVDLVGGAAARDQTEHKILTNRLIESLGIVGFYYPSVAFSALEQFVAARPAEHLPALAPALGRMYALHPGQVRAFLETWGVGELLPQLVRSWDLSSVKSSMERIGFFNNAAAQIALFPVMHAELVEPYFRLLGESTTLKTFIRRYTVAFLASLHRHGFHLAQWTTR